MEEILDKLNEIESSLKGLKAFVMNKIDTKKVNILFYPMNSFDKTIVEANNIKFIFEKFDEDKIKSTFSVDKICKQFNDGNQNLYAKKFTDHTNALLITDSFADLISKEAEIVCKLQRENVY